MAVWFVLHHVESHVLDSSRGAAKSFQCCCYICLQRQRFACGFWKCWVFYVICFCACHRWPRAMAPLRPDVYNLPSHYYAKSNRMSESACFVFVCLSLSVCFAPHSSPATQRTVTALCTKMADAGRKRIAVVSRQCFSLVMSVAMPLPKKAL